MHVVSAGRGRRHLSRAGNCRIRARYTPPASRRRPGIGPMPHLRPKPLHGLVSRPSATDLGIIVGGTLGHPVHRCDGPFRHHERPTRTAPPVRASRVRVGATHRIRGPASQNGDDRASHNDSGTGCRDNRLDDESEHSGALSARFVMRTWRIEPSHAVTDRADGAGPPAEDRGGDGERLSPNCDDSRPRVSSNLANSPPGGCSST
jgi:hypothetical protein